MYSMITVSSNLATNVLIELVNAKKTTATMRSLGASITYLKKEGYQIYTASNGFEAIDKAEEGDSSVVDALMVVLADPYAEHPAYEYLAALPPEWGKEMEISCSS